jgi:hypothetical protein
VGRRTIASALRSSIAGVLAAGAAACSATPITPARIEAAIAPTFANLVNVQVSWMGLPPMPPADFAVIASCRKPGSAGNAGSGDWICTLVWQGPDRQTLHDTFDLFVATDGCFTASAEGETLGGPTLKATDGREVRNLLYTFEGCFDTM